MTDYKSKIIKVVDGYAVLIPPAFEKLWGLADDEIVTWESPNSIFGIQKKKLMQYEGNTIREKLLSLLEKEPVKPLLIFYA